MNFLQTSYDCFKEFCFIVGVILPCVFKDNPDRKKQCEYPQWSRFETKHKKIWREKYFAKADDKCGHKR